MSAKIVGCYIPCSINLYGCIGYVYCRNDFSVTFVLVWVENRNIVIFTKFGFQNIVGLDDGLAPDQRQAMTQRNCVIYTFLVINILSYPSGLSYLDY